MTYQPNLFFYKKFGNKSISIANPTGWAVASSDYIPATVNDKFIVSGYVKTSNITGSSLIKVDFYNSSDGWIDQTVSYGLKGTHDWTTSGNFTANDKIDTGERHIGTNSMKITGQSGVNKFIKQRINISGDSSTKLTLSGWSKQVGSNETSNYLMQVAIHYTDGTTDWLGNNFSRVEDGWQHVAAKIEPTSTFDWIEVYYCYYDQTGG